MQYKIRISIYPEDADVEIPFSVLDKQMQECIEEVLRDSGLNIRIKEIKLLD